MRIGPYCSRKSQGVGSIFAPIWHPAAPDPEERRRWILRDPPTGSLFLCNIFRRPGAEGNPGPGDGMFQLIGNQRAVDFAEHIKVFMNRLGDPVGGFIRQAFVGNDDAPRRSRSYLFVGIGGLGIGSRLDLSTPDPVLAQAFQKGRRESS